jgi:protein-tyrosine phosphatase
MIRCILLVCTGNTCRSPMAEMMLRDMAGRRGLHLEVRSAGVAALDGQPMSEHAAEALRKRNVPIPPGAASSSLKADAASWADLILTMTVRHKQMLLTLFPETAGKTFTLKEYALGTEASGGAADFAALYGEFDIADPFGGPLALYEKVAEEIGGLLERVLDRLVSSGKAEAASAEAVPASGGDGTAAGGDGAGDGAAGSASGGVGPASGKAAPGEAEAAVGESGSTPGEAGTAKEETGSDSGGTGAASS